MLTQEKFTELKGQVNEAKQAADKAQGALDSLLARLKEEFGCATLKEAQAKLESLQTKRDQATEQFEQELKKYEKTWKPR